MNLLLQFWEDCIAYDLLRRLEDDESEFAADHSGFVVVDGEEGDYGVIKYTDGTGQLVAVRTVHGGDREDVEFTDYGRTVMLSKLSGAFDEVTPNALADRS